MRRLLVRVQSGVLIPILMPTYINKKTGETKVYSRTRTYINDDGTKREVDLATGEEISADWSIDTEGGNYKTITAKKSPTDGYGTR